MRSLITDLLQIAKHRPHPHATACTTTPATHAPYRAHRRQEARCPGGSAAHTAPPKLRARACCAGSPGAVRGVPHRHSCEQHCAAPCKRALQLSQPPTANAAHTAQVSSGWLKNAPFFRAPPRQGIRVQAPQASPLTSQRAQRPKIFARGAFQAEFLRFVDGLRRLEVDFGECGRVVQRGVQGGRAATSGAAASSSGARLAKCSARAARARCRCNACSEALGTPDLNEERCNAPPSSGTK